MARIRVMMVDDHAVFRAGVRLLVEAQPDMEVVGEAREGGEALQKARQLRPDVLVMDITMPGINGLEATRQIRRELPEVRVLVLTVHSDDEYFFRALEAGASGYVLKEAAAEEMIAAIRAVAYGGVVLYPSLARRLLEDYLQRVTTGEERESHEKLTDRERQVLALIAQGHTNQEIAKALTLSVYTVQTHRSHIMDKLDLHSKAQLMKYAIRMGFLRGAPGSGLADGKDATTN